MSGDASKVGYCRPPKHTQFAPGRSGNPKGRPKGSKNMRTLLREEMDRKVPVTEDGRQKLMTKRRIAVRQQVDKATRGDSKAFATLMKLEAESLMEGSGAAGHEPRRSEIPASAYEDIVRHHLADLVAAAKAQDDV